MFLSFNLSRIQKILLLGVLPLVLAGCPSGQPMGFVPAQTVPTPVVSDPIVSPSQPVNPGEEIGISIRVDSVGGVALTYEWIPDEGKGKILAGEGTSAITYQVPTEPGTYSIRVKVTGADVTIERSTFINVHEAETSVSTLTNTVQLTSTLTQKQLTETVTPSSTIPLTSTLTSTPIPQANTLTQTPVIPTDTPLPPTDTPVLSTNTPALPTATDTPPTNTSTSQPSDTPIPLPTNTPIQLCYGNCWIYNNSIRTMTWTGSGDGLEDIWQPAGDALQKIRDGYTAIMTTSIPGEIFACVLTINEEFVKNNCDNILFQVAPGTYRITSANPGVGGFRWCPALGYGYRKNGGICR